jgi:hypothetical protein
MAGMQHNFRSEKNRATRLLTPGHDETLIYTAEQAREILTFIQEELPKADRRRRAELLLANASIYQALGSPEMLEVALETAKEVKTAQAAALVAVAYHMNGRIRESVQWTDIAYRRPHEAGYEIDLNYANSLLFKSDWSKAWPVILKLKKRMVYAAYLKTWTAGTTEPVSVISEGGFGDIIHTSRYIPLMNAPATVYLPPYFFEHGFVDLMKRQPWMPPIKKLVETPQHVPAVGFFDFPAVFNTSPETIPPSPTWVADPARVEMFRKKFESLPRPLVGFVHEARAMETPLCPKGVYRALTTEQELALKGTIGEHATLVDLQYGSNPDLKSWEDNAALIHNLDAVITVDTANLHLAASMGKPTWVLLSGASDWKFGLEGDTTPWYPSIRVFRNNAYGFDNAVSSVLAAITAGELKTL